MSAIAIITARGGSKRIPRKNIRDFCGKPIIAYSIEAALNSKIFDEVMVSTDDAEIAEVSIRHGAKVPFYRSGDMSDDYATTADVLIEVLQDYIKLGKNFAWACCIYPTAPFVTADKLKASMDKLKKTNADALVPILKFSYPPQRAFVLKANKIEYKYPQYEKTRSQDLEAYYHDVGQYYFFKTQYFLKKASLILDNTVPFFLDEREAQDIDVIEDWEIAEMKYRELIKRSYRNESL